jgi:hypothetical protein
MQTSSPLQINGTLAPVPGAVAGQCAAQAPFDSTVYYQDRVFVVAEVDDTYVYHTHLGTYCTVLCTVYCVLCCCVMSFFSRLPQTSLPLSCAVQRSVHFFLVVDLHCGDSGFTVCTFSTLTPSSLHRFTRRDYAAHRVPPGLSQGQPGHQDHGE